MRIAIAANSGWYLYNFRRSLMQALREAGHRPVAISPHDEYVEKLIDDGFDFIELSLDASGTNPMNELATVDRVRRLLRAGSFEAAFTWTPKTNIYFGLVAPGLGIEFVPNVSGLGRVFVERSWLTPVVTRLYQRAFAKARVVIFQNGDDESDFLRLGVVQRGRTTRVPGSGVDLTRFRAAPLAPSAGRATVFLFVGRLLHVKGVGDLVEAARRLRAQGRPVVVRLLGMVGVNNPSAVTAGEVRLWVEEGVVEMLGATDDVRPMIAAADCVVAPSHGGEGVPRVLLEAAACARPCITTDVPGCRDAVDDGSSGFICPPRDVAMLARTLDRLVSLPDDARAEMGLQGRLKVERQFDERLVLATYLSLARAIDGESRQPRAA